MDSITANAFMDGDLQVQLRELERDAAAKTSVYENFLSRERQVAELEQISTTNVRTISTAVPPGGRSWPPGMMVMAIMGHRRHHPGSCWPLRWGCFAICPGRPPVLPPPGRAEARAAMARVVFHSASLKGGGAERVLVLIANAFAARGHDVTLFTWNAEGPNAALLVDKVRLVDLGLPMRDGGYGKVGTLKGIARSIHVIGELRPDAVYSGPEFANLLMMIVLVLAGSRAKFFPTVHAATALRPGGLGSRLAIILSRLVAARATRAIGVSDGVGRDLVARGFPPHKVVTINNPLPPMQPTSRAQSWHAELAAMGSGPVIGTAGRLIGVRIMSRCCAPLRCVRASARRGWSSSGKGPSAPSS